jgi:hypothetical protein
VRGGTAAGLFNARVQPEIGDELLGAPEPTEVTDRCRQRQRDRRIDARDRHQPLDFWALESDPAECGVDDP